MKSRNFTLALLLLSISVSHADSFKWNDGAGNNNWVAGGNWNQTGGSGDFPGEKRNTDNVELLGSFSNNTSKFDIDFTTSSDPGSGAATIADLAVTTDSSSDQWIIQTGAQASARLLVSDSIGLRLESGGTFTSDIKLELADSSLVVAVKGGTAVFNGELIGGGNTTLNANYNQLIVDGGNGVFGGTIQLAAANNDSFTGTVEVGATKLDITNVNSLRNATVSLLGFNNRFTFPNNALIGALEGHADLTLANNLIVGNKNTSTAYTGVLSGSGNFTKIGSGVLTLGGANIHTGITTVSAGKIQLSHADALLTSPLTVNANNGLDISSDSINANLHSLSGSGNIDIGAQTLTLKGNLTQNHTYSGDLSDGQEFGIVAINTTGAGKNILTDTIANHGGVQLLSGTVQVFDDDQLGSSGAPLVFGDGHLLLTSVSDFTLDHPISFEGTDSDAKLTVFGLNTTVTIGDTFTANNPDHSLELLSGGKLAFTGPANPYVGTIIVTGGQVVPSGDSLQSTRFQINTNDGLKVAGSPVTVGSLNGSGSLNLETDLSIGNHGQSAEYSGALSQTGAKSLTKTGGGPQIFSGTSTRTGPTIVNGGTLRIANSAQTPVGTGLLTVNSGATLDGHGIVGSPVIVSSGAFLEPSDDTSSLSMTSLELPGTYRCAISASSAATLETAANLDLTDGTLALTGTPGQIATIITSYGSLTGTFATVTGLPAGHYIDYAYSGNNIAIVRDTTPPTVAITTAEGNPTNSGSISYNIAFNEPVTGLVDFSDFYITGTTTATSDISSTVIVNSGDDQNYTLTLHNISGDGFLQFRLRASQIADLAGNNLATDPFSPGRTIDTTPPTVTITTTQSTPTNADRITYNIVFSEPVTGLVDNTDFYFTGTTEANTDIAATTIVNSGNDKNYTFTLNNVSGDDLLQFRLSASQIADLAGNHLSADPFAPGLTIDNTGPGAVDIVTAATGPVTEHFLEFTVTFDESVKGFDAFEDLQLTLTGTVDVEGATITGSGNVYTVILTGMQGQGTLALSTSTVSDVTDLAGNPLESSVTSAGIDIDIPATTYFVNASNTTPAAPYDTWATAATTLQDALLYAVSGDQIWMAQGVYYPDEGGDETDNDKSSTFVLTDGVGIYGGFSGAGTETSLAQRDISAYRTILSADLDKDDTNTDGNFIAEIYTDIPNWNYTSLTQNANTLITADGVGADTIVSGLVLTAAAGGYQITEAFKCSNGAEPLIEDCLFSGNAPGGASVFISKSGSHPVIRRARFQGNNAPPVIVRDGASATIAECVFSEADANAGDTMIGALEGAELIVRDCRFSGFSSKRMIVLGGASATVANCRFTNISMGGSSGIINGVSSTLVLINSLFSGNTGTEYGCPVLLNAPVGESVVTNCTFTGNRMEDGAAIFTVSGDTLTVRNCLFWNNQNSSGLSTAASAYTDFDPSDPTTRSFANCLIGGSTGSGATWPASLGTDGGGNLDGDPLFVTAVDPALAPTANGDLRLLEGSLALDAGANNADLDGSGSGTLTIADEPFDLAGEARVRDSIVDIGAYEGGFTHYGIWAETFFPGITDEKIIGPGADDDGDSIINILEYAFGLNPLVSSGGNLTHDNLAFSTAGTPVLFFASTPGCVDFRALFTRRADYATAGILYTVQFSNDLSSWESSSATPTVLDTDGNGVELVSVEYPFFLSDGRKARFFRVSVVISTP